MYNFLFQKNLPKYHLNCNFNFQLHLGKFYNYTGFNGLRFKYAVCIIYLCARINFLYMIYLALRHQEDSSRITNRSGGLTEFQLILV